MPTPSDKGSPFAAARAWLRASTAALKASDPYGRDVPSKLPKPEGGPYNPPTGSVPPGVIVDIPINTRDIEAELNEAIDTNEPKLIRWLLNTINANQDAIKDQEIRNAITSGQISETWLERWRQDYARTINEELRPVWVDTMGKAGDRIISGIDGLGLAGVNRTLLGRRYAEWIRQRSGDLIVDITEAQRRAINTVIFRHTVTEPLGPEELSRLIRPLIGLTERQAGTADRFYMELRADGVPEREARRRTQDRIATIRRRRARNIARTETAYAYNFGQFEAMREANQQQIFGAGVAIKKRWWAQQDERTCPWCEPLHDTVIGLEETFPGRTKRVPSTYVPPAHPQCRCLILYEYVDVEPEETPDAVVEETEPEAEPIATEPETTMGLPSREPLGDPRAMGEKDWTAAVMDTVADEQALIAEKLPAAAALKDLKQQRRDLIDSGDPRRALALQKRRITPAQKAAREEMAEFLKRSFEGEGKTTPRVRFRGADLTDEQRERAQLALSLQNRMAGGLDPRQTFTVRTVGGTGRASAQTRYRPHQRRARSKQDFVASVGRVSEERENWFDERRQALRQMLFQIPDQDFDPRSPELRWLRDAADDLREQSGLPKHSWGSRDDVVAGLDEVMGQSVLWDEIDGVTPSGFPDADDHVEVWRATAPRLVESIDRMGHLDGLWATDESSKLYDLSYPTSAVNLTQSIEMYASDFDSWILAHEYAHLIEHQTPSLNEASRAFLRSRDNGKPFVRYVNGRPDEKVIDGGGYVDPYSGKHYWQLMFANPVTIGARAGQARRWDGMLDRNLYQSTENVTMAVQHQLAAVVEQRAGDSGAADVQAHDALKLWIEDPDHFAFGFAALRGRFGSARHDVAEYDSRNRQPIYHDPDDEDDDGDD